MCSAFSSHQNQRALRSGSLSRDPPPDVRGAIHQRDEIPFTPVQKSDRIAANERDIPEIEYDTASALFRPNQFLQFGDVFPVYSAAQGKNPLLVRGPSDSQHRLAQILSLHGCPESTISNEKKCKPVANRKPFPVRDLGFLKRRLHRH
jgi:hypothetical protein